MQLFTSICVLTIIAKQWSQGRGDIYIDKAFITEDFEGDEQVVKIS